MIGLKTTGLQFGYFFALLFCILFLMRGFRENRLSDKFLSAVMFFLAMLIQDYTFGFAGINILWEEMDGWPRHFPWLFPASVYFYFLAQTNAGFRLQKKHAFHLVPYVIYLIVSLVLFVMGKTPNNGLYQSNIGKWWDFYVYVINYGSIFFYFIKCLRIYRHYKTWAENQFSNTYALELQWLRNFLWLFLTGAVIHLINTIVDTIYDLPFDQDYYWQLFTVVTIIYIGISGLSQNQDKSINFTDPGPEAIESVEIATDAEKMAFAKRLETFMKSEKPFQNPDLTLKELAKKLQTQPAYLSSVINTCFEKNFNDYINNYRVEAFQQAIREPENKNLTLIAVAYDCGFNSKATFHRAVKKMTGKVPGAL